ncbi:MAG: c-type cytochrome [Gemmatimonas sp.]|nr:c-type cytochrome [Gemmatimonas sp.]
MRPACGSRNPGTEVAQPVFQQPSRWLLAAIVLLAMVFAGSRAVAQTAEQGRLVYDRWCSSCHGAEGRGDGPAAAYMLPRPRDFTRGIYQIRTTPSGALPTDDDILRIIDNGMPGTAMPGWRETLGNSDRRALVAHLKTLSPFFESEPTPETVALASPPSVSDEGLEQGRQAYDALECWRCHGQQGRGDGPSAHEQADDDGLPIRPADLTQSWRFTGGNTPEDIVARLMTGLDGTPMPSQADAVASGVVTEEQLLHLANYVRSLSPDEEPRIREVVRAALVLGELPAAADDPAWDEADEFYLPLSGQIIIQPRWFAPTVNAVWVKAMHNGGELVLRIRWHDPSESPEARWLEWQTRVLETMEPNEGGPTEPQVLPDAFSVQFPRAIPEGMDRPYFLRGNAQDPVYLWQWSSQSAGATEALASGIDSLESLTVTEGQVTAEASWQDGEWVLLLRRQLQAEEGSDRLTFETGQAIPMAFQVWDGDNSEQGTRGAISTWYYIYLDEPGSNTIYAYPIAATALTFVLGLMVVLRAQRSPASGGRTPDYTQQQGSP